MISILRSLAWLIAAALLAACGPGTDAGPSPTRTAALSAVSASVQPYDEPVQRIYLAYFGRPADPGGLDYYARQLQSSGVQADIREVVAAYATSGTVRAIVDSFGTSAESQQLYSGDNDAFVTAVYRNLFSRDPDSVGKAYWVAALDNGVMTRANAALTIMIGAQGSDATIVQAKVNFLQTFTASAALAAHAGLYDGQTANAVIRGSVLSVKAALADDALANFTDTVMATLARLRTGGAGLYASPLAPLLTADFVPLTAVVTGADGTMLPGAAVNWSSGATELARPAATSHLMTLTAGALTLTATAGNRTDTINVSISDRYVEPGRLYVALGPEETVFDYGTQRCDDGTIPDLPAHPVRRSDGTLLMAAYPLMMTGSDFAHLKPDCAFRFATVGTPLPETHYNLAWINAPYRVGNVLHALVHNEYHDSTSPNCALGDIYPDNPCNYISLLYATSSDGGTSFALASPYLVAPAPARWDPDHPAKNTAYGYHDPTNIVQAADGWFYALIGANPDTDPKSQSGMCVMRTRTLADPSSWRAWDGKGFNHVFQDPYTSAGTSACTIVVGRSLRGLAYDTYLGQYIATGTDCGAMALVSTDLVHWNDLGNFKAAYYPAVPGYCNSPSGDLGAELYHTLVDHDGGGDNFETAGQAPYMYFTKWTRAGQYMHRDLIRQRVILLKSPVTGNNFTQPQADAGLPAAGTAISGALKLYGWAFDPSGIRSVAVQLDGADAGIPVTMHLARPDIVAAFPDAPADAGFSYVVDSTKIANGTHKLGVVVTSNGGGVKLMSVTLVVDQAKDASAPQLTVDAPTAGQVVKGGITISGWAVDNVAVQGVTVAADGGPAFAAAFNVARPDIVAAFPWAPLMSGFTVSLDTRTLTNGPHTLTVTASDAAQNRQRQDVQITVAN